MYLYGVCGSGKHITSLYLCSANYSEKRVGVEKHYFSIIQRKKGVENDRFEASNGCFSYIFHVCNARKHDQERPHRSASGNFSYFFTLDLVRFS